MDCEVQQGCVPSHSKQLSRSETGAESLRREPERLGSGTEKRFDGGKREACKAGNDHQSTERPDSEAPC